MPRLAGLAWIAGLFVAAMPVVASAQTATCDALQGDKRNVAQAVMAAQHPYACCDGTIAECAAKRPRCILARRLADDVCRRAAAGQDQAAIERALTKRAESMSRAGAPVPIDLSSSPPVGESDSKVIVTTYLCTRCPFCSKLVPSLHRLVTEGALKGKAKLHVKLFPIRTHQYSTEGGTAVLAAGKLGKFWPYLLDLYTHFDNFEVGKLPDYAVEVGLDRQAFIDATNDSAIRTLLVESKKEGIRNKVEATPTVFLNGYKFTGDLNATVLQDVIEEEHDRVTGRTTE